MLKTDTLQSQQLNIQTSDKDNYYAVSTSAEFQGLSTTFFGKWQRTEETNLFSLKPANSAFKQAQNFPKPRKTNERWQKLV